MTSSVVPWTPISQIEIGWFLHRWGDWLEINFIERNSELTTLIVVDTDGTEKRWTYRNITQRGVETELIATNQLSEYIKED